MHIVAIGWLYVTVLMAFTEEHPVAGVLTFFCYGLLPVALLWWLTSRRRRVAPPRDGYDPGTRPDQRQSR
ncbi:MAG TPA: hypothetical protein PKN13_12670 [Accumulibacter sp.]|nr:hypothetical protein [Accumulibacter sp.]HMW18630.1 hypothetical protein [Accumulibacter sp.]HMX22117.1 hypothetical protein [Accumulibacter sp.]HNC18674.1 hypothetical protein [Accumulibacter sp.]HND81245.1 hypothetical protein [Accumulibacter sp.]